jgi:hypothetical protein
MQNARHGCFKARMDPRLEHFHGLRFLGHELAAIAIKIRASHDRRQI